MLSAGVAQCNLLGVRIQVSTGCIRDLSLFQVFHVILRQMTILQWFYRFVFTVPSLRCPEFTYHRHCSCFCIFIPMLSPNNLEFQWIVTLMFSYHMFPSLIQFNKFNLLDLLVDVTMVKFSRPPNFKYLSGQWVRLGFTAIKPNEYHSLTLTSAPHENYLSVHVKAQGPWTWKLRNYFDPNNMQINEVPKVSPIHVAQLVSYQ